ncbi:hypothetical protein Tco_0664313 [Tanacetum coccineum]
MATTKAITYAFQCSDMIVESVQFQSNNFVGNFNYRQSTAVVEDPNPSTHDYEARWYRIFTKRQKQSQTRQTREQNWKERKKPKPKVQKD